MTLIFPLLTSNGSWGSELSECEGSPLDIESSAEDASFQLLMVFDWNNCQGKFTFDGEQYDGEFKYGLLHGKGIFTSPGGEQYDGEFKDGLKYGQGTYTYPDGGQYVGEWKDGLQHGHGTYTWIDGDKYVGEWKDDKRHGQGTYTYAEGFKQEGIWKEGKFLYENIVITNEDDEFCQEIGFTINTPEYDNCVQKSAEKD